MNVVSDSAIENAKARRIKLLFEINDFQSKVLDLRKELARVDQFIADWNAFAGIETEPESPVQGGAIKNPPRDEVGDRVEWLLDRNGAPMMRADLFRALAEKGIVINGKDPEMVLSTMMWRMQDKFVRIPSWGYWFRDRPFTPAKYKPGDIPNSRDKAEDDAQNEIEKLF